MSKELSLNTIQPRLRLVVNKNGLTKMFQAFQAIKRLSLIQSLFHHQTVTGKLHLGRLGYNFARYHHPSKTDARFRYLWLPGMDHAGIATQAKVEAFG